MKQFYTWAFFLAWPGVGHQSWDSLIALGMLVFYAGALWYLHIDFDEADHAYLEACSQATPQNQRLSVSTCQETPFGKYRIDGGGGC